jgi:hypothetical protein
VFERIDVLGATDFTFTLTAAARARRWDAAFGPGVLRVEAQCGRGKTPSPNPASGEGVLSTKEGQSGRGETSSASATRLIRGCEVVMGGQRPPLDVGRIA